MSATTQRLTEIRTQIDSLDEQLLGLLNKRASLSREVGQLKSDSLDIVFKPFREKEVLSRLNALSPGILPEDHLRAIYREILSSSRRLQQPQAVAYLGPEGTFTHLAGLEYLGRSMDFTPCPTLHDVFLTVASRKADLGVIPLENSLQGSVGQSLDLFLQYNVYIHAELFSRISHALLATNADLASVRTVYSHPQALAQCSGWLRTNVPQAVVVPTESTAAAAAQAEREGDGFAAIGHPRLVERYGLKAVALDIQDLPDNWTRFLVIGPTPTVGSSRDKTSLLFTTPDRPGALAAILNLLADQGLNLTKLESRPLKGEKWKYVFFMDVECDLSQEQYENTMNNLTSLCHTMRVLGSYPTGPHLYGAGMVQEQA
ncbi:MAG: prephenate dehydratase [Desulfomicrobium sp.]|nr:prephenate dehydratase [Pseudomonadota bacterium]MBV1712233.1 prephenate dehydratase [Desulfomicrobium sp.]MBU4572871.1 prephenate dehydratase [Pseudomonadota bacterium]MBU4594866.1 prephenate dehydratase [Pseudomonadota bacterium]MBV1718495.1 prephenate dehydratase [Desulfomicrobium sp.]